LVPLANELTYASRRPNVAILRRDYPIDRQRILGELTASAIGFDFRRGRLDTSMHPFFSTIGPGDCRISTRYHASYFNDGFFATLHETGHGLYEQGLDPEHQGTPLGEAASLGLHESQSRLWENTVGRSRPFWQHLFPQARQLFPEALGDVSLDEFHFAVNHVEPSLNRVRADEVTYNLHVVIRFELEQALLSGDLKAADLPAAWNDAYRHALGVTPTNDAEGCLQDGHWSAGMFGYFPTYTLGNIFAAQLYEQAERDLGSLDEPFADGDFSGLLDWLRRKVHREGSRYPAAELVERVTGMAPDPQPLLRRLRRKYGELNGL
jgi:carboxypeptidase Taq